MFRKGQWILGFIFTMGFVAVNAQKITYSLETTAWVSSQSKLPFWMQANQFGAVPAGDAISILPSLRFASDSSHSWQKEVHFQPFLSVGSQSTLRFIAGFGSLQRRNFRIWAGIKPQVMGLVDSLHSSGSLTWSGNAQAIPQVSLDMPYFQPLFKGRIGWKASFSHGWFGHQTYAKDYFLHQKSIYLRFGKPEARLKVMGGILHHAQWGGEPTTATRPGDGRLYEGKFPGDAYTFTRVVLPLKSLLDDRPGYNPFELENRFGSHLGQVDLAVELNGSQGNALFYKQILFETGATFSSLSNVDDGLYGMVWSPKKTEGIWRRLTLEYLQTTNQGTYQPFLPRLLNLQDRHFSENNFYFNHQQYFDGWSFQRRTIGTPFLIPEEKIRSEKSSNNGYIFTNNNRIRMFYLGMIHQFSLVELRTRFSFSRNFGSHWIPITPTDQFSLGIETRFPLGSVYLKTQLALDRGDLIKDNLGFRLSLEKIW